MNNVKQLKFWNFGGMYYFYFMIWALIFAFLPFWLNKTAQLDTSVSGLVFSAMAITALVLEPIYGVIQDKLGLKKYLFGFVVLCLLFIGPFVQFAFIPLLQINAIFGAIVGGAYLSLCLNGGVGVVEAYIERSTRENNYEYGHVRLFGSLAGGTAAFIGGIMFVKNPYSIFWACTISAIILGVLLWTLRVKKEDKTTDQASETTEEEETPVTKENIINVFKNRSFWGFCIMMIGIATMFDVFDQQFPNYFASFFNDSSRGELVFSRIASVQVFLEAGFMILAPWFINKIGAKNGLILAGIVLFIRVIGSAFFTEIWMLATWRLLAAIEMPLMLVSIMKYITSVFDVRLSATVYMLGFNFAKQIGISIFSVVMGYLYNLVGFQQGYVVLSFIILAFVIIGAMIMRSEKHTTDNTKNLTAA
ncbi:MFS transporter, OHS family, lactose permease [Gracilibacillus orientalis]|uniref:MFS transporter, OHS family, lactose permease n=1 Tax=Gracilibacillus orientalis TaxID=334253 RepID=A0A1I4IZ16_9BACI|nr:oligosaccharide MFS transporter [Gracilibacillus orientalis]SFL59203.1 MFS transporter, OHS family, lactose permease [Gracilibacillus orientalis]